MTCCRDKLYHYDESGCLTLAESALNSKGFIGGMAKSTATDAAMFSGRDAAGDSGGCPKAPHCRMRDAYDVKKRILTLFVVRPVVWPDIWPHSYRRR